MLLTLSLLVTQYDVVEEPATDISMHVVLKKYVFGIFFKFRSKLVLVAVSESRKHGNDEVVKLICRSNYLYVESCAKTCY